MSEKYKVKSLWGDLSIVEPVKTPYIILKEQATILTEATNGLLIGSVSKDIVPPGIDYSNHQHNFFCVLKIIAPSINNYSILIVEICYPKNFYPLKIQNLVTEASSIECKSEEDFEVKLEQILSSKEVKTLVFGLLNEVLLDKTE